VLVAAVLCGATALTSAAHATGASVTVTATATGANRVRITWQLSATAGSLDVQRSTDGRTFATLVAVKQPRTRAHRVDKHAPNGDVWYRACVGSLCSPAAYVTMSTQSTGGGAPTGCNGAAKQLFDLVNGLRKQHGLGALTIDASLQANAQQHSEAMARASHFFDDPPPGAQQNTYYGYGSSDFTGPQAAVNFWLGSDVHRKTMLDVWNHHTVTGVGCTTSMIGTVTYYWYTQNFG
jgi:uncharacterized protein YkwD